MGCPRLVIPRDAEVLQGELLHAAHDSLSAGHDGTHRTYRRLMDSHVGWFRYACGGGGAWLVGKCITEHPIVLRVMDW